MSSNMILVLLAALVVGGSAVELESRARPTGSDAVLLRVNQVLMKELDVLGGKHDVSLSPRPSPPTPICPPHSPPTTPFSVPFFCPAFCPGFPSRSPDGRRAAFPRWSGAALCELASWLSSATAPPPLLCPTMELTHGCTHSLLPRPCPPICLSAYCLSAHPPTLIPRAHRTTPHFRTLSASPL